MVLGLQGPNESERFWTYRAYWTWEIQDLHAKLGHEGSVLPVPNRLGMFTTPRNWDWNDIYTSNNSERIDALACDIALDFELLKNKQDYQARMGLKE